MIRRPKKDMRLHFVGIGGIGMSGIAEVFANQGYQVSGSDQAESDTTRRLAQLGISIQYKHSAENVSSAHVVVVSSAVKSTNPELMEAKRLRIPVIRRAEMLAELMRGKTGIALAGTHGKTTTTSMLATILVSAGLDPTLVIGGKVDSLGGNAKLGQGDLVVAEADESDGSFLHLPATYGVITNIDNDHLDHFGNLAAIEEAFIEFVAKLPFYGVAVVCGDDPGVKRCLSRFTKPVLTYGLSEECDFFAQAIELRGMTTVFEFCARQSKAPGGGHPQCLGKVELSVPGRHNVLNALAVAVIALQLGVPFEKIASGLKMFKGVKRRFEIRWQDQQSKRVIIDDYGHHPTEIAATLSAARQFWSGKIRAIFQPHRYSRTLHCRDGFLSAFNVADEVFLTDIYAAGEEPIDGVNSAALVEQIRAVSPSEKTVTYAGDLSAARDLMLKGFDSGMLLICFGAGSITRLPEQLIERLESTKKS